MKTQSRLFMKAYLGNWKGNRIDLPPITESNMESGQLTNTITTWFGGNRGIYNAFAAAHDTPIA